MAVLVAVFASHAVSDSPPPKDAEFVFARVQFNMNFQAAFDPEAPWHHDYPFSEDFFLMILKEVTNIHVTREAYRVVQLDSPDIFKYPFLYFSEPGFMSLTPQETTNLREWFNRGGFALFDDFRTIRSQRHLDNLRFQMKKVFPDRDFVRLTIDHPIFNPFYQVDSLVMDPPYFQGEMVPEFWGMSDDRGRLIALGNHNNDLGEFFEWVDRGEMPFRPAAKATRLAVNYLIYAMTH